MDLRKFTVEFCPAGDEEFKPFSTEEVEAGDHLEALAIGMKNTFSPGTIFPSTNIKFEIRGKISEDKDRNLPVEMEFPLNLSFSYMGKSPVEGVK